MIVDRSSFLPRYFILFCSVLFLFASVTTDNVLVCHCIMCFYILSYCALSILMIQHFCPLFMFYLYKFIIYTIVNPIVLSIYIVMVDFLHIYACFVFHSFLCMRFFSAESLELRWTDNFQPFCTCVLIVILHNWHYRMPFYVSTMWGPWGADFGSNRLWTLYLTTEWIYNSLQIIRLPFHIHI